MVKKIRMDKWRISKRSNTWHQIFTDDKEKNYLGDVWHEYSDRIAHEHNTYQELVEALEYVKTTLDDYDILSSDIDYMKTKVVDALKKAKGKS